MLLAAAALVVALLRTRRDGWEYVAVLGLCLATASAAQIVAIRKPAHPSATFIG